MRILDITPITDSAQMPIKKGTLQFLQDSHKETVANLIIGIIGSSYSTSKVYRLYGAELANTGGDAYTNTAGAVFYNGEVYLVDAIGGGGTNMPDGIDMEVYTTQYTTDADPVTFSDATTHNVHNIRKMRYKNNASPVLGQPVGYFNINTYQSSKPIGSPETIKFDINKQITYSGYSPTTATLQFTFDFTDAKVGCYTMSILEVDGATFTILPDSNVKLNIENSWLTGTGLNYVEFTFLGQKGATKFVNVKHVHYAA